MNQYWDRIELMLLHCCKPEALFHHLSVRPDVFAWVQITVQYKSLLALCEGNPPVTSGFPSQRASNAQIFWHCWTNSQLDSNLGCYDAHCNVDSCPGVEVIKPIFFSSTISILVFQYYQNTPYLNSTFIFDRHRLDAGTPVKNQCLP